MSICSMRRLNLQEYNTMHVETIGEVVYMPAETGEVTELFSRIAFDNAILLGQGSNTIFTERVYQRPIVITSLLNGIRMKNSEIIAEAGVTLSRLAWFALEHEVSGYEFLEDIPGSVGGALYMNAGTYESTIGEKVISVTVFDCSDHRVKELSKEQCSCWWGKRDSFFQHHPCFILQASFDASGNGKYEDILNEILANKKKRYMKQPRNYPSAGSVFKRPYINGEPRYIWQLFDEAGLRGCKIGDAQVSEKHPGFIVNTGNATGKEILDLMNHCKQVIWDQYGIRIEEEWKII